MKTKSVDESYAAPKNRLEFPRREEIISIQTEIIGIYEETFIFLNQIMKRTIEDESNVELREFAWATNDSIVDQPRLYELKQKLETLNKEEFIEIKIKKDN
ncbi:hypothetical protein ACEU2D_17645 [Brevibacillus laterosporus]|uniref:hypothetical protein n=1 Tax=Brevibacillus laterosporus TaxID=1465 RepID=UPI0035A6161F